MQFTPEAITDLKENEVFVYGSNQYSNHQGGAARIAAERFGALNGIAATGLCGQSYGIITTSFNDVPVTIKFISAQISVLYNFAWLRQDLKFYVTKIGTGIAGFTIQEIARLFHELESLRPNNIVLPKEFHK
jgi:hypothetical protein